MQLILLGPPGSGKGTLAQDLVAYYQIPHISTGDIFRRAIREETKLGLDVKTFLQQGALVPDELTIALVQDRLTQPDCSGGYLLDGFPRTLPQAEALAKMATVLKNPLTAVINLIVRETVIVSRLSNRRVCPSCGQTYNLVSAKPEKDGICDVCGHAIIQRPDDQKETVLRRLEAYHQETEPLIDYYRKQKILIDIDNERAIQETYTAVLNRLEQVRSQTEEVNG